MTTLYKKVGKRYKPVAEHEDWDSFPAGAHLVVCSPGSTRRRFSIERSSGHTSRIRPPRAQFILSQADTISS